LKIFPLDVIKRVFHDMTVFQHEEILLKLFKLCTNDQEDKSLKEKVELYHSSWGYTLLDLYKTHLPHEVPTEIQIKFELTPFTHFFASELAEDITNEFNLKNEDLIYIEDLYDSIELEEQLLPSKDDFTNYILQIMLFPPLIQLNDFFSKSYRWQAQSAKSLLNTVNFNDVEMPKYEINFALYLATSFISQETYKAMGLMDGLINLPELAPMAVELEKLKNSIPNTMPIDKEFICPHCGIPHGDVSLNHNDVFYAHLTKAHMDLHVQVGFYLYKQFRQGISIRLNDIFQNSTLTINTVKNSKCIILVEGSSEEAALPVMAIRIGKPLASRNILVMNCKSKQKVLENFKLFRNNFPNVKICVLLDSDAEKEKREIEKMIEGSLDRFSLSFIPKGEFEDLVPLPIVAQALNELYPTGGNVSASNFDENRGIIGQINYVLHSFNSKLDKVRFNKKASELMHADEVPDLIRNLINEAYKLCGIK